MTRGDCYWLAFVVAIALAFSVWGLTYFTQLGHPLWSIPVYVFLAILFLYGRANHPARRADRKGESIAARTAKRG